MSTITIGPSSSVAAVHESQPLLSQEDETAQSIFAKNVINGLISSTLYGIPEQLATLLWAAGSGVKLFIAAVPSGMIGGGIGAAVGKASAVFFRGASQTTRVVLSITGGAIIGYS